MMPISLWQKTKIMTLSLWATLCISLHILLCRYSRLKIDKLARAWARHILAIVNADYQVVGLAHLSYTPDRNYVLMSNHLSLYDIPLIFATVPGSVRMIAKKELFRVPIWGQAMRKSEFIAIDRRHRHQAIRDLALAKEKAESGIRIWIAPEGTRSRTGESLPFKKGGFILAKDLDALIIPMAISGTDKILKPDTWHFHLGQSVQIQIGEPIDTRNYAENEREALIAQTQSVIQSMIKDKA